MSARKHRPAAEGSIICARLKPGWRYDGQTDRFVAPRSAGGAEEDESDEVHPPLPRHTRIRPVIPELSDLAPESLSEEEKRLARTVHLLLPGGSDPSVVLKRVVEWSFVDAAWLAPTVSPAFGD